MKLYFFGDSFTYGHGLPDCADYDPKQKIYRATEKPSKYAWPNLVSKELKAKHENLSLPGMSNLHIHWKLRHTKFEIADIAVVQWSFPYRCVILNDDSYFRDLHSCIDSKETNYFFRVHTDIDLERRSLLIIEHTELLLKSLGIKYIMLANSKFEPCKLTTKFKIVDYQQKYVMDRAVDGSHPGIESNNRWATRVTKIIKQKFNI